MLNITSPPSVSMLLEIEKLVLDEISDFNPSQGINLGPAPEGHRDPIAKILSSISNKRKPCSINKMTSCDDIFDCDSDEDDDDDDDDNDSDSESQNDLHGDSNSGDKENDSYIENVENSDKVSVRDASRKMGPKRKSKSCKLSMNCSFNLIVNNRMNDLNGPQQSNQQQDDGYQLSPCFHVYHSNRSNSPVHIISGPNHDGHSVANTMDSVNSPEMNKFVAHELPEGCEKVNMVKDTKKSNQLIPDTLSHVIIAPCPQKPCNPGFVLLPSQSSAFLPATKTLSDNLSLLDDITDKLDNTDLGTFD